MTLVPLPCPPLRAIQHAGRRFQLHEAPTNHLGRLGLVLSRTEMSSATIYSFPYDKCKEKRARLMKDVGVVTYTSLAHSFCSRLFASVVVCFRSIFFLLRCSLNWRYRVACWEIDTDRWLLGLSCMHLSCRWFRFVCLLTGEFHAKAFRLLPSFSRFAVLVYQLFFFSVRHFSWCWKRTLSFGCFVEIWLDFIRTPLRNFWGL